MDNDEGQLEAVRGKDEVGKDEVGKDEVGKDEVGKDEVGEQIGRHDEEQTTNEERCRSGLELDLVVSIRLNGVDYELVAVPARDRTTQASKASESEALATPHVRARQPSATSETDQATTV